MSLDLSTVIPQPIVGIITGMTHQSGAEYYMKINDTIQKQSKWKGNTCKILIYSVNLEECCSYQEINKLNIISKIVTDAAYKLYRGGVDYIVITCNTAHLAVPRIKQMIPHMPILHIADCCAFKLKKHGVKVC